MEIKLTWIEQKKCSKIVNISFNEEHLKEYLNECGIYNKDQLIESIEDYCNYELYNNELHDCLTEKEQEHYYDGLIANVTNIEEIFNKYNYLITTPYCCDNQTGNYCSVCGTKLN